MLVARLVALPCFPVHLQVFFKVAICAFQQVPAVIFSTPLSISSRVRFNCFSMYYATPVGQASNPGPDSEGIRLAICNPTAVHKKVDLQLKFNAQIIVASETSATNIIQKQVSSDLKSKGFRSLEPTGCT